MSDPPAAASWNDLPPAFLERLPSLLSPEDMCCFERFVHQPRALAVRLTDAQHTRADVVALLEADGFAATTVEWMPEALLLTPPDRRRIQETAIYGEGGIFIQSLSSMAAVEALEVSPGLDVLDCCAAPGGKASLIRYRQRGQGILVANDLSRRRVQKMQHLFKQIHVEGVDVHVQPGETLGGSHANCFDRVLLDAPCSGEGRFRLEAPSTWSDWTPGKIRRLAKLQQRLLRSAIRTLRPNGVLVYATCTLAPEENELVVSSVLRDSPVPIVLEPIPISCAGGRACVTEWCGESLPEAVPHAMRILPEAGMTPFFLARLRRV
ncbi:MAG: RsmB/NOP family class I SAM-dependent RNA methyltransferase [Planctomycetota bacterium]|nr:RsmB/NOP family class I SAM-dependent RNA methyltransferase [Planctomycetota bacterium]